MSISESKIIRNPKWKKDELFISPYDDVRVLRDILQHSIKNFPNRPCMGRRYMKKLHLSESSINGKFR